MLSRGCLPFFILSRRRRRPGPSREPPSILSPSLSPFIWIPDPHTQWRHSCVPRADGTHWRCRVCVDAQVPQAKIPPRPEEETRWNSSARFPISRKKRLRLFMHPSENGLRVSFCRREICHQRYCGRKSTTCRRTRLSLLPLFGEKHPRWGRKCAFAFFRRSHISSSSSQYLYLCPQ